MQVIYLIQSDTNKISYKIPNKSDILLLQWQKDYQKTVEFPNFHMPNSSWASGRNELYKRSLDKKYDYYIFLDDDLILHFDLEQFEDLLSQYRPNRCVPCLKRWDHYKKIINTNEPCYVRYIDHCFMALSREAAKNIMPYTTDFDKSNWWKCGELFCAKYSSYYNDQTLLFPNLIIKNLQHRNYPRNKKEIDIKQKFIPITDH